VAGPAEMIDIGLVELMDGDGVTVIEWADKVAELLPHRAIHVSIEGVGDEPRTITIVTPA
jgi:tRNA threonylcarbamoyladenosine biosynthesis protein TsaE